MAFKTYQWVKEMKEKQRRAIFYVTVKSYYSFMNHLLQMEDGMTCGPKWLKQKTAHVMGYISPTHMMNEVLHA